MEVITGILNETNNPYHNYGNKPWCVKMGFAKRYQGMSVSAVRARLLESNLFCYLNIFCTSDVFKSLVPQDR